MAFVPTTGSTGTVAFGTSALTLVVTEIGEYTKSRELLDASALNTTGAKEFYPAVLDDVSTPINVVVWFNPGVNLASCGTGETITLTYPKSGTGNNAATLAGTGVITSEGTAAMRVGALMAKTMQFRFDGLATNPAFTAEVA